MRTSPVKLASSQTTIIPTFPHLSECSTPPYSSEIDEMFMSGDGGCTTPGFFIPSESALGIIGHIGDGIDKAAGDTNINIHKKHGGGENRTSKNLTLDYSNLSRPLDSDWTGKPLNSSKDSFDGWSWVRRDSPDSPKSMWEASLLLKMRAEKERPSFYELRDLNIGPVDDAPHILFFPSQYLLDELKDYRAFNNVPIPEKPFPGPYMPDGSEVIESEYFVEDKNEEKI